MSDCSHPHGFSEYKTPAGKTHAEPVCPVCKRRETDWTHDDSECAAGGGPDASERERVSSARKVELSRLLMEVRDMMEAVAWIAAQSDEEFEAERDSALLSNNETAECLRRWGVIP